MSETRCSDMGSKRKSEESYSSRRKTKLDDSKTGNKNAFKETKTSEQDSFGSNFGKNYLSKFGYKDGFGLGKHGDGIVEPVEASKQKGRRGLGFEPVDLQEAASKFDPEAEKVSLDEEVIWLSNRYTDCLDRECLKEWMKIDKQKTCINEDSYFCDSDVIRRILQSKNLLDKITVRDLENARGRANPFESIHNAIFLNRAAMKMANLDAILDRMFTNPKSKSGEEIVKANELLYFADVCAGPGGFSEYVFFRKKWRAKGFGFTLRSQNDFLLDQFWAGPSETFEPYYGVKEDGNVYDPDNILSFKNHVLKNTDGEGVHFMMADGGIYIDTRLNDQELVCKKLYLCQCLIALHIVRTGGHFVVKLFDLFSDFSVGLIYLMYRSFNEISIIKPNTSRPANSERYLVCKWKREDCQDIADHLFEVNRMVPIFDEKQLTTCDDVVELVPAIVMLDDDKFYSYVKSSNERLGEKQIVSLIKLTAFSENVNAIDERQPSLRKLSLEKWGIPDEARAEPKKSDARTKWTELVGKSSLLELECDGRKKSTVSYFEDFKSRIVSKCSWNCLVLSGEEDSNNCLFYLGLGRNNIYKYAAGKWTKLNCSSLCLPANTLVYGELVQEFLGTGKSQRKIFAFHIIDGLYLGDEKIENLPFAKRLDMCRLFAQSLYKETCPVRVKECYKLNDVNQLWESLVLKSTKSSSLKSPCIPLESDSFFKARGLMFIKDVKDLWNRHPSSKTGKMYLYSKNNETIWEQDISKRGFEHYYANFEDSFRSKLIWWWDEGVVVHEEQNFPPDPKKLQKANIQMIK